MKILIILEIENTNGMGREMELTLPYNTQFSEITIHGFFEHLMPKYPDYVYNSIESILGDLEDNLEFEPASMNLIRKLLPVDTYFTITYKDHGMNGHIMEYDPERDKPWGLYILED